MKHAFGRVQDFMPGDAVAGERFEHVVEIAICGFVAADILSGVDAVEVDTQAERDYLKNLALRLAIAPHVVSRIHTALGVA